MSPRLYLICDPNHHDHFGALGSPLLVKLLVLASEQDHVYGLLLRLCSWWHLNSRACLLEAGQLILQVLQRSQDRQDPEARQGILPGSRHPGADQPPGPGTLLLPAHLAPKRVLQDSRRPCLLQHPACVQGSAGLLPLHPRGQLLSFRCQEGQGRLHLPLHLLPLHHPGY